MIRFLLRTLGILALTYLIALASMPVMRMRFALWSEGVREWKSASLTGYEQDHCEGRSGCECIALVHGLGDDALTWRRILTRPQEKWSRAVRLVAVNLPGTGQSPPPAEPSEGYRARVMGETLAESLRADSSCKSWILVGNSHGGWVATWTALNWSAGIRKLILVGSAGLKPPPGASQAKLITEPTVESLKEFQAKAYHSPRPLPESVWKMAVKRVARGNSRQVSAAQKEEDYLDAYLGGLRIPTLLLWGDSDRIITPERGRELGSRIRGAQFREARQCGHLPQKECPEVMVGVIEEMIRYGAM